MNTSKDQKPLCTTEVVDTDDWGFRAKITTGDGVAYVQVLSLSKLLERSSQTKKTDA